MNKITILSILLFMGISSYGQRRNFEKPDYKEIEKNIQKKDSKLFYPSLMERYQRGDSTLTLEEKRHLYYGYTFQPSYSPYEESDYADSLRVMMQKEDHSESALNKIIQFGDSVLAENPFDFSAIDGQLYALDKKQENERVNAKIIQFRTLLDALMSSGDGKSKRNSFYVIYTSHEYVLLEVLGFQFGGSQSLIEHYDYLELVENEAGIKGLYFDISPCLNALSKMFKK